MTEPTTTEPTTAPQGEPAPAGEGKTDAGPAGGEKAILAELKQERLARQELAKQLKELQQRDPVKAIAEALGMKPQDPKDDKALAEQVKQMQEQMRAAELKAARLEVAAANGLTPAQAARLQGSTREELEADAATLKELFPGATSTPGTPAPDPTQGSRGSTNALEAQLKAAQDKGDAKEAIRLKNAIAAQKRRS